MRQTMISTLTLEDTAKLDTQALALALKDA